MQWSTLLPGAGLPPLDCAADEGGKVLEAVSAELIIAFGSRIFASIFSTEVLATNLLSTGVKGA